MSLCNLYPQYEKVRAGSFQQDSWYNRMNSFGFYALFLQLTQVLTEDVISYKGYRVYEVYEKGYKIPKLKIPDIKERLSVLKEHQEYDNKNNPLTVRSYLIPQHREEDFLKVLNIVGARYNVSSRDLAMEIEEERRSYETPQRWGYWDVAGKYFSHAEICQFLLEMGKIKNRQTGRPLAVIEPIGKSLEGRNIYLVKISSDHGAKKPIIFFEAGIHAREWTAPSAVLYTIHQLVVNYTHTSNILAEIDFYIIPLSNPDGYEYSRTADRLWRKTRSFYKGYYGVDGNRNFGYHWGEAGASNNPASEIFKGPFPFSEAETRSIRNAGKKYKKRINVFVSVHAYGPCILYPWSYKITTPAPQADIMEGIAKQAADTMKRYGGTQYAHGSSSTMMYEAAGGSDDYFKGSLGVDLSFTFELSSAKRSSFIVPTHLIHEIVAEAFEGFKVIAENGARYRKKSLRGV